MKQKKFFYQLIYRVWIHLKHYLFGKNFIENSFFFIIILNSRAFPQQLTMKQMDTDHIRIYIREIEKDIFYQLEDMR